MSKRFLTLLAAGAAVAALAGPATAQQNAGVDRRFERIERSLRTLEAAVLQAQATGQPVLVRPEGPDPLVAEMQQRLQDLEQTLQRINGQVETLGFELEQMKRAEAAAEADRRLGQQGLNDRLARMEQQLAALAAAAAPDTGLSSADPALPGGPPDDATRRAQAQDRGALVPPPPPPPPTAAEAFGRARQLYDRGEFEEARRGFEDFVARYPSNARAPEAYYWLGESFYAERGYQTATAAYASALRTRPTTAWAPAAMARLAQSLANSNQNAQACAALAEFDQRYAVRASAAVKANADAARRRARCG